MARTVDSDIAVINGATCNGQVTSSCQPSLLPLRTGGWPSYLGPDPAVAAMYMPDKVDGPSPSSRSRHDLTGRGPQQTGQHQPVEFPVTAAKSERKRQS